MTKILSKGKGRTNMELHTKIESSKCPRCGNMVFLECTDLQNGEPNSALYDVHFDLCLKCGYSGRSIEPPVPEMDELQVNDIPNAFSGLCCLKLRSGGIEFYGISSDTTDEIVSWFTSALLDPDIDPSGSYLNWWRKVEKTILRIGVDKAKRGPK